MSASAAPFVHAPEATYRGTRNYVHSTDVYEEILAGARAGGLMVEGPFDLRMRKRIKHTPIYHFAPAEEGESDVQAAATCAFRSGGKDWRVLVSEGGVPVTSRKPYDEAPVWSQARHEEKAVALDGGTGMRPIEVVTALGVLLHKTMFPPGEEQRWMLVQLELSRLLEAGDSRRMTIVLERSIGATMTRSSVIGEDGRVGRMLFVLG